jgi:hypothetical protein
VVEPLLPKQTVAGSTPVSRSTFRNDERVYSVFGNAGSILHRDIPPHAEKVETASSGGFHLDKSCIGLGAGISGMCGNHRRGPDIGKAD